MNDGDENDTGTDPGTSNPPPEGASNSTNPTRDQIEQMVAARVAQAQRGATTSLVKELGFANKAELERFLQQAKDTERAQMTEAERLAAEAKEQLEAAKTEREAYAERIHNLAVREALVEAGVAPAKAARAARLVEVERGADAAAISEAVEAAKGEFPELFGGTPTPRPPSSEPASGGPAPTRTNGMTALERGAAAAKQRLGRTS